MSAIYSKIFPCVHKELAYWKQRAQGIADSELRHQALESINTKTFHCEGGSIYAILAGDNWREAIRFIVAYQTISDYLDNLCDRSTSLDPEDFEALHESMLHALTPGNETVNYYRLRDEQDDSDYLRDLVLTCQEALQNIGNYESNRSYFIQLAQLYSDLQVHKHVKMEERVPRLTSWFKKHQHKWQDLTWYEFSACTGSTLGIFCLASYGFNDKLNKNLAEKIFQSYFPYMQGLHILLDYYIDQKEDAEEGDLNFCNYYEHSEEMKQRLVYFIAKTEEHVKGLPDGHFHKMIQKGLVGMYLADTKVQSLHKSRQMIKSLLRAGGVKAKFFYFNTKLYHKIRPVL